VASYRVVRAAHKTLSGTTVDDVTMSGTFNQIEVMNRSGAASIFFTVDGSTPTVAGDDTDVVVEGTSLQVRPDRQRDGTVVVKVIGNGNDYSIASVTE
jgi:hypothetical protein